MLDYSKDTPSNAGLPEAWLESDFNDVTQIENKYIKYESNRIKKHSFKSNQKPYVESNQKL